MNHSLLLSILLVPSTIHAMEALVTEKDIITYCIAPKLDRQDRTALKITNKKFCAIIVSQHIINQEYKLTCLNNNTKAMNEWRRQGALNSDKEIYQLFINNKREIVTKIMPHNHHDVLAVFLYGVKQNNVTFMQWLLNTRNPRFDSCILEKSLARSKRFNRHEITQLLTSYIESQRTTHWDDIMTNVTSTSDLLEHAHIDSHGTIHWSYTMTQQDFLDDYAQKENTGEQNCIIS